MDKTTVDTEGIKKFYEILKQGKSDQKGYILLPSINGFDVHEIDEENLKCYLKYDNMRRNIISG